MARRKLTTQLNSSAFRRHCRYGDYPQQPLRHCPAVWIQKATESSLPKSHLICVWSVSDLRLHRRYDHNEQALVVTAAETRSPLTQGYIVPGLAATVMVAEQGQNGTICSRSGLGRFAALAPRGAPNVHVFAGDPYGINKASAHHWASAPTP